MKSNATPLGTPNDQPAQLRARVVTWLRWAGAGELAFFVLLACFATWPLAANLGAGLPVGTEPTATVPLFNAWTIWWNAEQLQHLGRDLGQGYWQAPIFHPAKYTFALSEAQPTTMLVAPAVWLGSPLLAYNVYLLGGLAFTGWSGFVLLRRCGLHQAAAVAGGAMLEMLPMPHHQLGVLQLTPLWPILLTFLALQLFGERPTMKRGMLLGLAFSLTYLTCNYYGLFLAVLLPVTAWWLLGRAVFYWRFYAGTVCAVAVAGLLVAPVVYAQLKARSLHGMERDRGQMEYFSAEWADYTAAPWTQLTRLPEFADAKRAQFWPLSPGYLKMLLALAGFTFAMFRPKLRWFALFLAATLLCALLLSRGLKLELLGWKPYLLLVDYVPGFTAIRTVLRFAIFVQISTAALAALAVQAAIDCGAGLWRRNDALPPSTVKLTVARVVHVLAVFVLSLSAVVEVWPDRQSIYTPPAHQPQQKWLHYLRDKTPADAVVVCLPFPQGRSASDYQGTALWMYWGCYHKRSMVNGYSGYFPDDFLQLKPLMTKPFPSPDGLDQLRRLGVTHCVVERSVASRRRIESDPFAAEELKWVAGDTTTGVDIYQLLEPVWLPVDPDNLFMNDDSIGSPFAPPQKP